MPIRIVASLCCAALVSLAPAQTVAAPAHGCAAPAVGAPPTYYAIDLVSTARVPGTRGASGTAAVRLAASPFGVSLASDGQYAQDVELVARDLPVARDGHYVAWLTTPALSPITRLGELIPGKPLPGRVPWNKFLVVITLEQDLTPDADAWRGPIVLRGISRSGRMHTMAGHGAFEAEPCAKYGY